MNKSAFGIRDEGGLPVDLKTRPTLLEKIGDPEDNSAWDEFVSLYGGMIRGYARKKGCQETAADDVLQETLVRLLRRMPEFTYRSGKGHPFRSFLLKIVHGCMVDMFRREGRFVHPGPREDSNSADVLEVLMENKKQRPAQDSEWDLEWTESLLAAAFRKVRSRIEGSTFSAFQDYVIKGESSDRVAQKHGTNPNTVYQQANRIKKMLQEEVEGLLKECGEKTSVGNRTVELLSKRWQPRLAPTFRQTVNLTMQYGDEELREHLRYLRKVLGESNPAAGKGPCLLVLKDKGENARCPLADGLIIGASDGNDIVLEDEGVSHRHARIEQKYNCWRIVDLDSTNGVLVNGNACQTRQLLDGDVIQLANATLVFLK